MILGMEAASVNVTEETTVGKALHELMDRIKAAVEFVTKSAGEGTSLYEVEQGVLGQVLGIGHKLLETAIQLQGNGDLGATCTTSDNRVLRRSQELHTRELRTIFGQHEISQYVYREYENRKIELRPIDARLGLSPRVCSQLLEEFTQMFCVENAFGQAARNFQTVFRQSISVDTLEAVSRKMGDMAKEYSDQLPVPPREAEGEILVTTLDGKGVPLIRESETETEPVKAFQSRRLRPGDRRIATLAGAYSVDRHERTPEQILAALFRDPLPKDAKTPRPKPQEKHLSVHFPEQYEDGEAQVSSTGALEACSWLSSQVTARRKPRQPLLLLIDGDHRLWDTANEHLPADRIEILDIVHVSAYVWEAAGMLCSQERARESFTRTRLRLILQGRVKSVIRGLRYLATARNLRGDAAQRIATIANYLDAHAKRMRYHIYLAAGYPIATGVIEGACRHVVKDRMERTGMRWTLVAAKAMLNLRAVSASGHWDDFHTTRRQKEIERFHPHRAALKEYLPTLSL
jgi:hypothetical protein